MKQEAKAQQKSSRRGKRKRAGLVPPKLRSKQRGGGSDCETHACGHDLQLLARMFRRVPFEPRSNHDRQVWDVATRLWLTPRELQAPKAVGVAL